MKYSMNASPGWARDGRIWRLVLRSRGGPIEIGYISEMVSMSGDRGAWSISLCGGHIPPNAGRPRTISLAGKPLEFSDLEDFAADLMKPAVKINPFINILYLYFRSASMAKKALEDHMRIRRKKKAFYSLSMELKWRKDPFDPSMDVLYGLLPQCGDMGVRLGSVCERAHGWCVNKLNGKTVTCASRKEAKERLLKLMGANKDERG